MSDREAIQGFWRIVSHTRGALPATHYEFAGNKHREIIPDFVDDGKLRSTFKLNERTDPKRIVITLDYNGPSGPPDPHPIVLRGFYQLAGDSLKLCFGPNDEEFPEKFSREFSLTTLKRHRGPAPETKKASGKPPIEDDVLGRLIWEDNFDWYSVQLPKSAGGVEVSLTCDRKGSVKAALARGQAVVKQLKKYALLAKKSAAEELLDLKNDNWLNDGEKSLTAAAFIKRLTLQSMVIDSNGEVTFYHNDGDLFWGHSVQVVINAKDKCIDADIPG